jgi:phosphatidyl-myo-inositol dimannoside synthase
VNRLSLWIVTSELHLHGGTERSVAERLERWSSSFAIRLYTTSVEGIDVSRVEVVKIPRVAGPAALRFSAWLVLNHARRSWDRFRRGRPDVVHSPGINCLDADLIQLPVNIRRYWGTVRSQVGRDLQHPRTTLRAVHRTVYWGMLRALARLVYSGPATTWAPSRREADELEADFHRPPGSVAVIPNGVDTQSFSPSAIAARRDTARRALGVENRTVLLVVGNDAFNKGMDLAIRSLGDLGPETILALAGNVDATAVSHWTRRHAVNGRVLMWPHRDDVRDYFAAADVVLVPSRRDMFSQPALEALACGVPLVVSDRAGAAELVSHGEDALVVDPEDRVALSKAIADVLVDRSLRDRLSRAGRATAERWSWDENARSAAELIVREATTPRVLVLASDAYGTGGIERSMRSLVSALTDLIGADRVGLLSIWGGSGDLPCRVLSRGRLAGGARPVPLTRQASFAARTLLEAYRWRRRLVIVAGHPHLAPLARAASRLARAPYAVLGHGEEVWRPIRPSIAAALRSADAVAVPSRFTANEVMRWAAMRDAPSLIPHALPPEMKADPSHAGDRIAGRVLTVARLVPEHRYKGVDSLISVWPRVKGIVPSAELIVVGDGDDRPRLERSVLEARTEGVTFVGRVDDGDLRRLYATASVFALPVRTTVGDGAQGEGFGLVFVEAAAAGLPVVAGKGGAIPEVVSDGETGILIDPADPHETERALVALLTDEGRRAEMGKRASARAATSFSFDIYRARIGELLRGLRPLPTPSDFNV